MKNLNTITVDINELNIFNNDRFKLIYNDNNNDLYLYNDTNYVKKNIIIMHKSKSISEMIFNIHHNKDKSAKYLKLLINETLRGRSPFDEINRYYPDNYIITKFTGALQKIKDKKSNHKFDCFNYIQHDEFCNIHNPNNESSINNFINIVLKFEIFNSSTIINARNLIFLKLKATKDFVLSTITDANNALYRQAYVRLWNYEDYEKSLYFPIELKHLPGGIFD